MDENGTIQFPFSAKHLFWTGLGLAVVGIVIREIPGSWQLALTGLWTPTAGALSLLLVVLIIIGQYVGPVLLAGSYVLRAIEDRQPSSLDPTDAPTDPDEPTDPAPKRTGFWSSMPPRARAAQLWWTGIIASALALLINLFGNTVLYKISLRALEILTDYLSPVIQVLFVLAPALAMAGILVAALERRDASADDDAQ